MTHTNTNWWYTATLAAASLVVSTQAFPVGVAVLLTAGAVVGAVAFGRLAERTPFMQTRRFAILVGVLLLLATGVFLAVVLTPSADANPTGGVRAPSAEPKVVRDARRFDTTSQPFVVRRHPHHNGRVQHRRFCITPRTCRVVRIQQVVPREARKALAPRRRGGGLARAACCGYPY